MKRALVWLLAPLTLAGCVVETPSGNPNPAPYAGAYVAPGPVGVVGYDAFYDGAYGPLYDGYWDRSGVFFYRRDAYHPYVRDTGNHFRRAPAPGYRGVHVHGDHPGPH
jgi:hypothetical protein